MAARGRVALFLTGTQRRAAPASRIFGERRCAHHTLQKHDGSAPDGKNYLIARSLGVEAFTSKGIRMSSTCPRIVCSRTGLMAWAVLITGLLTTSDPGFASDEPRSDCAGLAARIGKKIDVTFDHQKGAEGVVFFKNVRGAEIQLQCSANNSKKTPTISIKAPAEYPSRSFYEILGEVGGSASGLSPRYVRARAHRCHRVAKRSAEGRAHKRLHAFSFECQRSQTASIFLLTRAATTKRGNN